MVWVFARSDRDGIVFHGHWSDLRSPEIELHDTLAFWPRYADGRSGVDVRNPDAPDPGCWRYRFRPEHPPECLADDAERSIIDLAALVPTGPWRVHEGFDSLVVRNATSGEQSQILPGCSARELARWPAPPRVLAKCHDEPLATFALWSPEQTWTFSAPLQLDNGLHLSPRRWPVTALERYRGSETPMERWLDLESGRLVRTPPAEALVWGGTFGFHSKILLRLVEHQGLWLLDLQAGTLERITEDVDCGYDLIETDSMGDRAVIGCNRVAHVGGGRRLHGYVWTEVIDFARKQRWRTKSVFEPRIAADGTVAGVTRGNPAHLAVIDPR